MQIGINSEWKLQATLEIVIKHWSVSKVARMTRVPMLLNYISSAEHVSWVELHLKYDVILVIYPLALKQ